MPTKKPDKLNENLYGDYEATCTWTGCGAKKKFEHALSSGLNLGDMILPYSGDAAYGRCLKCKRYMMQVTSVPVKQPPPKPKGFTRIPTE